MKMQEIFCLLHFAVFELQNEIIQKSSGVFDVVLRIVCEKVWFLPKTVRFC